MQGVLQTARKFLFLALLAELPVIIVVALRIMGFSFEWQIPPKINVFLYAVSVFFAIVGFAMVCRQLNLWEDALENSSIPGFLNSTRLLGSGKITLGVQLFFYGSFFVPILNLPAILWGRSKAKTAIHEIDTMLKKRRR